MAIDTNKILKETEEKLKNRFSKIDEISFKNQKRF